MTVVIWVLGVSFIVLAIVSSIVATFRLLREPSEEQISVHNLADPKLLESDRRRLRELHMLLLQSSLKRTNLEALRLLLESSSTLDVGLLDLQRIMNLLGGHLKDPRTMS